MSTIVIPANGTPFTYNAAGTTVSFDIPSGFVPTSGQWDMTGNQLLGGSGHTDTLTIGADAVAFAHQGTGAFSESVAVSAGQLLSIEAAAGSSVSVDVTLSPGGVTLCQAGSFTLTLIGAGPVTESVGTMSRISAFYSDPSTTNLAVSVSSASGAKLGPITGSGGLTVAATMSVSSSPRARI